MVTPGFATGDSRGSLGGTRSNPAVGFVRRGKGGHLSKRVPVVRTTPLRLPELLPNQQTQLHQTTECSTNLANTDRQERQTTLEVGDKVLGGQTGPGTTRSKATGGTPVPRNDTNPEGHLLEAQGLQGRKARGHGAAVGSKDRRSRAEPSICRHFEATHPRGQARGVDRNNPRRYSRSSKGPERERQDPETP